VISGADRLKPMFSQLKGVSGGNLTLRETLA